MRNRGAVFVCRVSGMLCVRSIRLPYLVFTQVAGWLAQLSRSPATKGIEILVALVESLIGSSDRL